MLTNMSDYVSGKKTIKSPIGLTQRISLEKGGSSSKVSEYRSLVEESGRHKGGAASSVSKASDESSVSPRQQRSKISSVSTGSEEYFCCDPCSTAGDDVEAHGFCTDCGDYLCGLCFESHSKNRASRNHNLLDKSHMPKKSVRVCDPCKLAGTEEVAEGFCKDCRDYLCRICYRSHSRNKASRHHSLVGKDSITEVTDNAHAHSTDKIGILERNVTSQKEKFSFVRAIDITTSTDTRECYVSKMAIVRRSELLLADVRNESLKLVDLEKNVIKGCLKLGATPSGMTILSDHQVAVVLSNECIVLIISISGGMSLIRTIKVGANCADITYADGKLYASFKTPVMFRILELTGRVIKTVKPRSEVLKHIVLPCRIAVSPDLSMLYTSDWTTNKVVCLDMDGNMVTVYGGDIDMPVDIYTAPDGSVYLCNRNQHVIYKMTSVLNKAVVLLGRKDGLCAPHAMCFNEDKNYLYIGSGNITKQDCNFIKVYQRKYT